MPAEPLQRSGATSVLCSQGGVIRYKGIDITYTYFMRLNFIVDIISHININKSCQENELSS